MSLTNIEYSRKLTAYMNKTGITKLTLGKRIGVSRFVLFNILNNRAYKPLPENAQKIDAFLVSIEGTI